MIRRNAGPHNCVLFRGIISLAKSAWVAATPQIQIRIWFDEFVANRFIAGE
jgi:hypothetical protein